MHFGSRRAERTVIKSHIYQINDLLVETRYEIRADGRGREARWYLRRRRS